MGKKTDAYDAELEQLQLAVVKTQAWTIEHGLRVVIVLEGRDTAEPVLRFKLSQNRTLPDLPCDDVPARARRVNGFTDQPQWLTTWILHEVLPPRLPADGLAVLALTATDLWPGRGWNFVFGQATLQARVGVWSLARNGDPDAGEAGYREALLRTLKTAAHETGHMLSIRHCTAYECGMCGSNSRPESDRRPLAFCPGCEAKVWWATGADPVARFTALADWCRAQGLAPEADHFARSADALGGATPRPPASPPAPAPSSPGSR